MRMAQSMNLPISVKNFGRHPLVKQLSGIGLFWCFSGMAQDFPVNRRTPPLAVLSKQRIQTGATHTVPALPHAVGAVPR